MERNRGIKSELYLGFQPAGAARCGALAPIQAARLQQRQKTLGFADFSHRIFRARKLPFMYSGNLKKERNRRKQKAGERILRKKSHLRLFLVPKISQFPQ